jgi:hypothetical protein
VSTAGEALIEAGLASEGKAAQSWAELSEPERRRIARYVGHGFTGYGRRKRARQMLLYLGWGTDSIRAFFKPVKYPYQPTPYVR